MDEAKSGFSEGWGGVGWGGVGMWVFSETSLSINLLKIRSERLSYITGATLHSAVVLRGVGGGLGVTLLYMYKLHRYVRCQRLRFLSHVGLKWVYILTILVRKSENGFRFYRNRNFVA